jgi:prepilin-type N-terminal cleavage/methylation domain-containing protein
MRARRGGFTLVEVIVGMAVAALAIAAGFGALAAVGDRARHAEDANVAALEGAAVRALLSDWLENSRLAHANERFQGIGAATSESGLDELIFPTTASTPLHEPTTLVRLYIDSDPETPERGLVAELSTGFDEERRRFELVPGAGTLALRYLPVVDAPHEWQEEWLLGTRPAGVELVLQAAPGDTLPALLRLPLRVALETIR